MAEQKSNGTPADSVPEHGAGDGVEAVANSLIVVDEPALEHLSKNKSFVVDVTKSAKKMLIDGLTATKKNGEGKDVPDHQIRLEYLKETKDILGLSHKARAEIRNTVQRMQRDQLEFNDPGRKTLPSANRGVTVPRQAIQEMS